METGFERKRLRIGLDVGSTTLKVAVVDTAGELVHKAYRRHNADFNSVLKEEFGTILERFPDARFSVTVTGSAGMGIAERSGVEFVQEVVASIRVAEMYYPSAGVIIDLGGEDAKMVFLDPGRQPDIRMNGGCAGGTGAFIDQMADLMNIPVERLAPLADRHTKIYPIASRCGVFAKTDIQNLISRNVAPEDISASIFYAVALQCVTTLMRGRTVGGGVLCIGGPLTFIPALRNAFREVLKVGVEDMIVPDNGELFPALGAAVHGDGLRECDLRGFMESLSGGNAVRGDSLPPLFSGADEYGTWCSERNVLPLREAVLHRGDTLDCYLGIDSGSTTTKIVVTDSDAGIVFCYYAPNQGNPLKKAVEGMQRFYDDMETAGVRVNIVSSAVTGYGEDLVRSAFGLDWGIVETMAHLTGAQYVDPQVTFVLDIGGQDMKSLFVSDGTISNIELNEACSSGCGSFLQNFASTMGLTLEEFTREACLAAEPSDLGTRCTVFMNSKVKQALRESASLGDIAAGLAYSVVKNCLFKVLKLTSLQSLGDHIVVQGGTFRNDAVYRALELLSGKSVSSTDRPEIMGAFGAALYARKMHEAGEPCRGFSGVMPVPDRIKTREIACGGCQNRCTVLRFEFENGNVSFAGNKCEKVFYNRATSGKKGYNAFDLKNRLLFDRHDRPQADGLRIGLPRALNMYENYPFWHTLLSECGFRVVLSPESTFGLYRKGVGCIMSDNICFPAKLTHGHIAALAESGVDRILYPMVIKEHRDFGASNNSFNCPVVSGYPDVIRSSMEPLPGGIPLDRPIVTFSNAKALERACEEYLASLGVDDKTFRMAFGKALAERDRYRERLAGEQKKILDDALASGEMVFVVAGRPYHADALVNQKVGQIISDLGIHVLTDDVFCADASDGFASLNLVSQWSYPDRVVQAAMRVAQLPANVQMIQLNSFGCGPDSFFMDETGAILRKAGKNHTVIRIDEISSPGSVKLRLRSFVESLRAAGVRRCDDGIYSGYGRTYTKDDRRRTILVPWLADFISPFVPAIGEMIGYRIENLPPSSKTSAETGLRYGHNEVCYPSTLVTGDIISALQSGRYDPDDVVVAITQTGGQCRATNYVSQIKAALTTAGFSDIPVLILSAGKAYQNEQSAFRIPVGRMASLINMAVYTILYGDGLNQMYSATVVRERVRGTSKALFDRYVEEGIKAIKSRDHRMMLDAMSRAVDDFNRVDVVDRPFVQVGLVGEIFVKYNNYGQAHITEWLRAHGMEVVTPPILDFVMQYFVNSEVNMRHGVARGSMLKHYMSPLFLKYMNVRISAAEAILRRFRYYRKQESVFKKAEYASEILELSNQFGEGWSVAAEVACYARAGVKRVVCVQPFGCIANHIVAKGIERRLRQFYPEMNILYLDLDGGASEVNLQNRLYFLIRNEDTAVIRGGKTRHDFGSCGAFAD